LHLAPSAVKKGCHVLMSTSKVQKEKNSESHP
jgi:hypothetical protein